MAAPKKTVAPYDWKSVKNLLEDFHIQLAQTESMNYGLTDLPLFGYGPGDAQALAFPKQKGNKLDSLILFPHYREETPTVSVVMDILHEAAHLILNDEENDEDRGVAQVELALSLLCSPLLFKEMIELHNSFYVWNEEYGSIIHTKTWHQGHLLAKKAVSKVKTYPWKTIGEHRKDILSVLGESKKARPRA